VTASKSSSNHSFSNGNRFGTRLHSLESCIFTNPCMLHALICPKEHKASLAPLIQKKETAVWTVSLGTVNILMGLSSAQKAAWTGCRVESNI
jgi:hypothetical protein